MKTKVFILVCLVLITLIAGLVPGSSNANTQPTLMFARANHTDVAVYFVNQSGEYEQFMPRHDRIFKNSVQRLELIDPEGVWAKLYPDNGLYSPWFQYDGIENTYVRLEDFTPITNFEPITIYTDTQNRDKQIIVVRNYYPEIIFLEGERIIAKIPTCVGGYYGDSTTPLGDHQIDAIWVSRHMNTLPGVPFTMFYSQGLGTAVHGAPWRDWNAMDVGCYGSAGCINLPPPSKYDIFWDGEWIGFDNFAWRWAKSIFPFDPYTQEPYIVSDLADGWYEGDVSLRVVIVESIEDLWLYPTQRVVWEDRAFTGWENVIAGYYELGANIRLPRMNEAGEVEFLDTLAHNLPIR